MTPDQMALKQALNEKRILRAANGSLQQQCGELRSANLVLMLVVSCTFVLGVLACAICYAAGGR